MQILKAFRLEYFLALIVVQVSAEANGFPVQMGSDAKADDFVQFLKEFLQVEQRPTTMHFLGDNFSNDFRLKLSQKVSVECLWIQDYSDKYSNELLQSLDEENTILFVVDLSDDCGNSSSPLRSGFEEWVVKRQDEWRIFAHPLRWLVFVKECDEMVPRDANAEWMTLFERANILVDSNVVIADVTNTSSYRLSQVYKVDQHFPTKIELFGIWIKESNQFLDFRLSTILSQRRNDLGGRTMRVASSLNENDTFNHLTDYRYPDTDTIVKIGYMVMDNLMDFLNASSEFSWFKTYNEDGVQGSIRKGQTDISGTPMFITGARVDLFSYTSFYVPTKTKFVFRSPPLSSVENILILSFNASVWYCVLALFSLLSLILVLIWKSVNFIGIDEENPRFSDVVIYVLQILVQMGATKLPQSFSGRICFYSLALASYFLYTAYTAKIVVLSQSTTDVIKTTTDLMNSKLECALRDVNYNRFYIPRLTDPLRIKFRDRKLLPLEDNLLSMRDGIRRVQKEQFAFFVEVGAGYNVIQNTFLEHEKCGLQEIEFYGFNHPAFVVYKNSPHNEMIKVGFLRVQESGLRMRHFHRLYTPRPKCESGAGRNFESMTLNDCSITIAIFLSGSGIALFLLIIENILHRKCP